MDTTLFRRAINQEYDPDNIDVEIRHAVETLRSFGYETTSSCQGGEGHMSKSPTILLTMPEIYEGTYEEFVDGLISFCLDKNIRIARVNRVLGLSLNGSKKMFERISIQLFSKKHYELVDRIKNENGT